MVTVVQSLAMPNNLKSKMSHVVMEIKFLDVLDPQGDINNNLQ